MKITKLTFQLSRTVNTGNYENTKAEFGMGIEMDDEALDVGLINKELKHQVDLLLDPDYRGDGTEWLLKDVGGYTHEEKKEKKK